jgi:hypothetical protein
MTAHALAGPVVVIAEPHHEMSDALEDIVTLAGCIPVTVSGFESLDGVLSSPAAIVVRVASETPLVSPHQGLEHPGPRRPLIVALASTDADVAEAERLQCEVIARAPYQVQALYDALTQLAAHDACTR